MTLKEVVKTSNMIRTNDEKYELVCSDVRVGIPAATACLTYDLNYNTFMKRLGVGGVRMLRQKNEACPPQTNASHSVPITGTRSVAEQVIVPRNPVTTN